MPRAHGLGYGGRSHDSAHRTAELLDAGCGTRSVPAFGVVAGIWPRAGVQGFNTQQIRTLGELPCRAAHLVLQQGSYKGSSYKQVARLT